MSPRPIVTTPITPGSGTTSIPAFAVLKGVADGTYGDRMGVYGYRVDNDGVFAKSEHGVGLEATGGTLAAYLDGDVEITRHCTVTGNHVVKGDMQFVNPGPRRGVRRRRGARGRARLGQGGRPRRSATLRQGV
jgi:hypothetical protein